MKKDKLVIIDNQYFPCVNYFKILRSSSNIMIEACENWQKNSFRNRCIVAGSNGLIPLSIPIVNGRDQKTAYKDIKIAGRDWIKHHWKTICNCYSRAPFFEYYQFEIEELLNFDSQYLFEFNLNIIQRLKTIFKIKCEIKASESFYSPLPADNEVVDYRNVWLPKNYQTGQNDFPFYFQLFTEKIGFQKNISILDLLFCEGPNAMNILGQDK